MKVCSKWMCLEVSWVDFELLWCTSMKVYMTFEPFFVGYFWPFWPFSSHFRPYLLPYRAIFEPFGTKIGSFRGDFWPFLGRSGVVFDIILASFWHHFEVVLVSFWPHFGVFLLVLLFLFFGTFLNHFCPFWPCLRSHGVCVFCDVLRSWLQK